MNRSSIVLGLLGLAALSGCNREPTAESAEVDITADAITTRRTGTAAAPSWPVADPSKSKTTPTDLKVDDVVKAMKKLKSSFYDTTPTGFSKGPTASFNRDEPRQCLQACPEYYSDVVCHYYCWHPSYDQVVPNIRGCFSQIARGSFAPTAGLPEPGKPAFYSQIYDYCTYQPFDAVKNPNAVPKFDQATIDKNKAKGKKVGVNAWVDDEEADTFKHVMFTWYDPMLFTVESQQEALNKFYGVKLSRPDYGKNDAADIAECKKARRRTAQDANVPDGMECSTKKDYKKSHDRHPQWAPIAQFMNGNDPSLQ